MHLKANLENIIGCKKYEILLLLGMEAERVLKHFSQSIISLLKNLNYIVHSSWD